MSRWGLRVVAALAGVVLRGCVGGGGVGGDGVGGDGVVAVNQILNGEEWKPRWLLIALALGLVAEGLNQWLAHRDAPQGPGGGAGPGQLSVYLKQLRAHVQRMETIGIATRGAYVLRLRQVYVE